MQAISKIIQSVVVAAASLAPAAFAAPTVSSIFPMSGQVFTNKTVVFPKITLSSNSGVRLVRIKRIIKDLDRGGIDREIVRCEVKTPKGTTWDGATGTNCQWSISYANQNGTNTRFRFEIWGGDTRGPLVTKDVSVKVALKDPCDATTCRVTPADASTEDGAALDKFVHAYAMPPPGYARAPRLKFKFAAGTYSRQTIIPGVANMEFFAEDPNQMPVLTGARPLASSSAKAVTHNGRQIWEFSGQTENGALSNSCKSAQDCSVCITLRECIKAGNCDIPLSPKPTEFAKDAHGNVILDPDFKTPVPIFRDSSGQPIVDSQSTQKYVDLRLDFLSSSGRKTALKLVTCARPVDLYRITSGGTQVLAHTMNKDMVKPGRWFYDFANDKIYLGDSPSSASYELSVTKAAFQAGRYPSDTRFNKSGITIRGFRIEKFASEVQRGAIQAQEASGWKLYNNVVQLNHGGGARLGPNAVAKLNRFLRNGQLGVGGSGVNITFEQNELAHNHWGYVRASFEVGGSKFASTDGLKLRCNHVHRNRGSGLWVDVDNKNSLIEKNIINDNAENGIHLEISERAIVRDNVIKRNGSWANWLWHGQILVSTARSNKIYDNVVEVGYNRLYPGKNVHGNGISVVQQDRCGCKDKPTNEELACFESCRYKTRDNFIFGNRITHTADVGMSGLEADFMPAKFYAYTNKFDRNRYHLKTSAHSAWARWGGDSWDRFGQSKKKSYDSPYTTAVESTLTLPPQETSSLDPDTYQPLDATAEAIPTSCAPAQSINWATWTPGMTED